MTPLRLALFLFVVFGVSLIAVGGAVLLLEPALAGHPRPPWRLRCSVIDNRVAPPSRMFS